MCSASQPSRRACQEAMRRAWHFLPRSALPPYPEPTLQISLSSGKWRISRRSGERSASEWSPATKSSSLRMCWIATRPTRVIRCMLATTYALSVTMTPVRLMGEPGGPMR